MKVTLTPVLEDLRALYAVSDRFERFDAYVSLHSGISRGGGKTRGEPLPIGTFSPMGERQGAYLDHLIFINAESLAHITADDVATDFEMLDDRFRLMLVVADVPKNGWTQRQLTDAEWRFTLQNDRLPNNVTLDGFDRWVSVLLWTDTEATETYLKRETRGALYRALHRRHLGPPNTLLEMMQQEGRVLAYAGHVPELDADELVYSLEVITPYLRCTDFPTCFAALYGDAAAKAAGYEALGLGTDAGFQLALHGALGQPRAGRLEFPTAVNPVT